MSRNIYPYCLLLSSSEKTVILFFCAETFKRKSSLPVKSLSLPCTSIKRVGFAFIIRSVNSTRMTFSLNNPLKELLWNHKLMSLSIFSRKPCLRIISRILSICSSVAPLCWHKSRISSARINLLM